MNNFDFYSPTEFVFGRGVQAQTAQLVKRYGGSRVMIVYGGSHAVKSGLLAQIEKLLDTGGLWHVSLGGVHPNPLDDKVREGADLARRESVDFMLAVGGGSVIDTAKGIAAATKYDGADFFDFYTKKAQPVEALPVGVVLTIPAAGSEASGNSVITNSKTHQKLSLRTQRLLRPKFAVMNPELTMSLPAYQTAAGATDMMAHVMERYFTNTADTTITDHLGEAVMRSIIEVTPTAISHPDNYQARANLMWCGTLAHNGICGNGNEEDWASHFMEHEISALYDVTHGAGLAVVFPAWLTWMSQHHVDKLVPWAERVWLVSPQADSKAVAQEGIKRLKAFLRQIGMPTTFAELGIKNPDIAQLVANLHRNMGAAVGNYVKLTAADTEEIYRLML